MRICPLCQQKYDNAEIRFCGADGQPLIEQENLAAQSQPQLAVAEQVAAPFSASLAMAFFAHHFVEQPGSHNSVDGTYTSSGSTNVPCQPNVKVNSIKLAYNLLAIAFWHLRENNLIRFTPGAKQGFIFKYTPLIIEFSRLNQTKIPGLEFDLMEIIKQSVPGVTIFAVVQQLLGQLAYYPHEKVFQRLTQWMIQLGYGQPDVSPKPFFSIRNAASMDFEFTPDCQRIEGSQQAAQIIHGSWMKFQAEQSDVFRLLYDEVERAVRGNTKLKTKHDL
jgi:hypothetical protein